MASAGWNGEARPSGQKRQRVLGYIKAANEMRQSYQQSVSNKWQESQYDEGMPGAFPDADITRSGHEEMLLFPSYARKHTKGQHQPNDASRAVPGARESLDNPNAGDEDYWKREWQKYEDENAIVDVDVRGWIYSPQRGPLSRKNRLLLAVARRLSGIPPLNTSPSHSRESSQGPGWKDRAHEDLLSYEEEVAAREADLISRRGQKEAEAANRGKYSADNASLLDVSPSTSRSPSPTRLPTSRMTSYAEREPEATSAQKRQSWSSTTSQMSREEIINANDQLVSRLRPFMTSPLANTAITIFFYNEQKSQSKSVYTDDSGHFKVRAALDFVPNKVRVLASEQLSATEDVEVTDAQGISLVSDIDDTIKHSSIASGAKEIFRNTFIRELGDLTVPGVKEWYTKMAGLDVKLHYVSNSPWQLYPLLKSFFVLAGLPPGSFHLKQYSGMLQGIFEPAAERKKGSLDRIMHDFPDRKFVLVGDSGEADLEVYTDIVQEHPGRVLGVFIRDVTSKEENNLKHFFSGTRPGEARRGAVSDNAPVNTDRNQDDQESKAPERRNALTDTTGDLIDFSDDKPTRSESKSTYSADMQELQQNGRSSPQRPTKPAKPSNLRSITTISSPSSEEGTRSRLRSRGSEANIKKHAPPPVPAPRRTNTTLSTSSRSGTTAPTNERSHARNGPDTSTQNNQAPLTKSPRTLWQESPHHSSSSIPQRSTNQHPTSNPDSNSTSTNSDAGYLASARHQLSTAYNAIPPLRSQSPSRDPKDPNGLPLPLRRGLSSYPAAAARFVTGASGGDPAAGGDGGAPGAPYDKKLEMWKRRWTRSEEIMRKHGVVLRTWRSGSDVMDECTRLVEKGLKEMGLDADKRVEGEMGRYTMGSSGRGRASV